MKRIESGKYLCPVCKGKGRTYNHALGVFSFGIAYLLQASDESLKEVCERCGGKGYIKI